MTVRITVLSILCFSYSFAQERMTKELAPFKENFKNINNSKEDHLARPGSCDTNQPYCFTFPRITRASENNNCISNFQLLA